MKATVTKTSFGKMPTGQRVDLFTLANVNGLVAKITNFGTIITELQVPDRHGGSSAYDSASRRRTASQSGLAC